MVTSLLTFRFSFQVPERTRIVSPSAAASIAAWMVA
jgi:hypothetical protein